MKKLLIVLGILVIALFSIISWYVGIANQIVSLEQGVKSKWSQVENVYQRRMDLIPNLVNTVKGYAAHESQTLEDVIKARSQAPQITPEVLNNPEAFQKFQQAQSGLSSALSRLMVVVERYPDLKANQNFLELQAQLEGTENRIAVERKRFNDAVEVFNSYILKFPQSFVAGIKGAKEKPYFAAEPTAQKAPTVDFGN